MKRFNSSPGGTTIAERRNSMTFRSRSCRMIRLFALAFLLVTSAAAAEEKPLVIASVGDVSSLDPHLLDSNHPTGSVIWSLFDSLVRRGPDGADLPRLATSWERTDDH